jgi:hypothetical protein
VGWGVGVQGTAEPEASKQTVLPCALVKLAVANIRAQHSASQTVSERERRCVIGFFFLLLFNELVRDE